MANSVGYHEDEDKLSPETKDRHRAIASMMEELEAVDWYDQRVQVASDDELREILAHNRDEEKEHFVMALEWLRRHDAKLDSELRGRLFQPGSIVAREEESKADTAEPATAAHGSLGIGSLKGGSTL